MDRIRTKILALAASIIIFSSGAFAANNRPGDSDLDMEDKALLFLTSSDASDKCYQTQINCLTRQLPVNYKILSQFINPDMSANSDIFALLYDIYKERSVLPKLDYVIVADSCAVLGMERGPLHDNTMKLQNFHIVLDEPYIEENIKLINSLFPRRRKIIFVGSDERQKRVIETLKLKFDIESDFKNISGMSKIEIVNYAKSMDRASVLFLPSASDMNENSVNSEEAVKLLCNNTDNPIFTCHDLCFGDGILGGYFVSQERFAKPPRSFLRIWAITSG